MGFPRRQLGTDEELVLALRPHGKELVGPVLVLLLVAAVTGAAIGRVPEGDAQPWLRLALAAVALVVVSKWSVGPFLRWWTTLYAITTQRLVTREGVLHRRGHDMPLARLNDVSFSHNLWERMLGCGTLVVESGGERGQLVLRDVPRVEHVQRTLYQLADAAPEPEPEPQPAPPPAGGLRGRWRRSTEVASGGSGGSDGSGGAARGGDGNGEAPGRAPLGR